MNACNIEPESPYCCFSASEMKLDGKVAAMKSLTNLSALTIKRALQLVFTEPLLVTATSINTLSPSPIVLGCYCGFRPRQAAYDHEG
jgi:hypothetical protein